MLSMLAAVSLAHGAPASGQALWTCRAALHAENTTTRANDASPRRPDESWQNAQVLAVSGDGTFAPNDRIRIGAGATGRGTGGDAPEGRLRELYVSASAAPWLDVEAGKRLVRWGVGYGFSPAGVLDPERNATDPTDRLNLNEGEWLTRADMFRGGSSLTVVSNSTMAAARFVTLVRGIELGLSGAAGSKEHPRYAATFTYVVGQQLEWHAEALLHEGSRGRTISAAAGAQYTFRAGLNVVMEYHRNGRGLDDSEWTAVLEGRRPPGQRPVRRNAFFLRAARAAGDVPVEPEVIVIASIDDNSWTIVPAVSWIPRRHLQLYVRAVRLAGGSRSVAGAAPFAATVTAGVSARF